MIKGMTFDCWDTLLIDDNALDNRIKERFVEVACQYGHNISMKKMNTLFKKEEENYRVHVVEEKKTQNSHERALTLFKLAEIDIPNDIIEEFAVFSNRIAIVSPPPVVPGIKEILDTLSKKYPLAVICNTGWHSGKVVRELLEKHGLQRYFLHLTFSDEAGLAKPHRHIYEYTLEKIGIDPGEAVHIGDSEYSDITGARDAGMKTILFAGINKRNKDDNSADITISSYDNLYSIIGNM